MASLPRAAAQISRCASVSGCSRCRWCVNPPPCDAAGNRV